jgi:hypothetical protein
MKMPQVTIQANNQVNLLPSPGPLTQLPQL